MNQIKINNCVYNIHQVYDLYAVDKEGNIINIVKKVPMKGNKDKYGYMLCGVRKYAEKSYKTYRVHRFVWECFNGNIPEDKVIDHINEIKDDNRLINLQLLTNQENCKKSAKNRDYSYYRKNPKCVKAINIETKEITYYKSIYATKQDICVNSRCVMDCCLGIYKSSTSKKNGQKYRFEYVKKEDIPEEDILKKEKLSEEEKRKRKSKYNINKEWYCNICANEINYKMAGKTLHLRTN